jgi:hypothetical protein
MASNHGVNAAKHVKEHLEAIKDRILILETFGSAEMNIIDFMVEHLNREDNLIQKLFQDNIIDFLEQMNLRSEEEDKETILSFEMTLVKSQSV